MRVSNGVRFSFSTGGPDLARSGFGAFADYGDAGSPAPYLKQARTQVTTCPKPVVDRRCGTGPEHIRVLRDGLPAEAGLTTDGSRA
ncbi:MAG: hypothetical protein OXU19_19570 [bacterium]|nr:hypothetical protein [bacterium]MDE0239463.1 hypothetical protein [bacterium]MDE0415504.1 hypothetical protein [bacterium]